MALIDHRRELFTNIARLRRAERGAPDSRDIVAVRTSLEAELGPTVSRRLAASLLGLSPTALGRWIETGDIPVVPNVTGRDEVPVPALLDLHDAVNDQRAAGTRRRHVLEPVLSERRERARRLDVAELVPPTPGDATGHRRADIRGLAYHRALAPQLRRSSINDARHLIWQWREQGTIDPRHADRWERVLGQPIPEIRRIIGEDTDESRELRQTSPFAGMLSEPERRAIIEQTR
jgi:hypothetical protein